MHRSLLHASACPADATAAAARAFATLAAASVRLALAAAAVRLALAAATLRLPRLAARASSAADLRRDQVQACCRCRTATWGVSWQEDTRARTRVAAPNRKLKGSHRAPAGARRELHARACLELVEIVLVLLEPLRTARPVSCVGELVPAPSRLVTRPKYDYDI